MDYYTWSNTTKLAMDNGELYMDARVSPLSLTYYGFCLGNGNYTVNLHFAEIMFTDNLIFVNHMFNIQQMSFDHHEPFVFGLKYCRGG